MRPFLTDGCHWKKRPLPLNKAGTEGYTAGKMKHRAIFLIDKKVPVIVIAPHDGLYEKTVSNMQKVMARGSKLLLISGEARLTAPRCGTRWNRPPSLPLSRHRFKARIHATSAAIAEAPAPISREPLRRFGCPSGWRLIKGALAASQCCAKIGM